MRPETPRLRINSEDVDGPPIVHLSNDYNDVDINLSSSSPNNSNTNKILNDLQIEFDTSDITTL